MSNTYLILAEEQLKRNPNYVPKTEEDYDKEREVRRLLENSIMHNLREGIRLDYKEAYKAAYKAVYKKDNPISIEKLNLNDAEESLLPHFNTYSQKKDAYYTAESSFTKAKRMAKEKVWKSNSILGFISALFTYLTNTDKLVKETQKEATEALKEFETEKIKTKECITKLIGQIEEYVNKAPSPKPKSSNVDRKIRQALQPTEAGSPSHTPRPSGVNHRQR